MANEFENLDSEESMETFSTEPTKGNKSNDVIAQKQGSILYYYEQAPDFAKAPARIKLDGKILNVVKADIRLPPLEKPWLKTRKGDKDVKFATFTIQYSEGGQTEFYSGVRIFRREEDKYSHPTITRDRGNQASQLFGLYADFVKKDINEITLREFMLFLNKTTPKCLIKTVQVKNPVTGIIVEKNLIEKFLP